MSNPFEKTNSSEEKSKSAFESRHDAQIEAMMTLVTATEELIAGWPGSIRDKTLVFRKNNPNLAPEVIKLLEEISKQTLEFSDIMESELGKTAGISKEYDEALRNRHAVHRLEHDVRFVIPEATPKLR